MAKYYKHIVVVHGIGRQQLNETGVNLMNEFCRALPDTGRLEVVNLVSRDTPLLTHGASVPAYIIFRIQGNEYYIGFSEVFWQPITKGYLAGHSGQTPVPVFTWAHSINSRIRDDRVPGQSRQAWREAIDNAQTLLNLADKLATISRKSKAFKEILCDFLGDVQMYAEVDPIHDRVNRVFRAALEDIAVTRDRIPQAVFASREIYIVAHSEGTVVSWRSLMLAAAAQPQPAWLKEVQGFVTLGSPIDKHHLFWNQNFPRDVPTEQNDKIRWWNFWDYSDPVGHSLEGIFGAAAKNNQFERVYDAGFARYPVPGVAHVDYWQDPNIYHRIIQEVMGVPSSYTERQLKTDSLWWGHWWFMSLGERIVYGLGRTVEILAMVYFLSRLLSVVRERLLNHFSGLEAWLDFVLKWPVPGGKVIGAHWINLALWVAGPALVWKLIWDGILSRFQARNLTLKGQFRVERFVGFIFAGILVLAALDLPPIQPFASDRPGLKDYTGWAAGLVISILVWKLHTVVAKGLVQLWRYGKGGEPFTPPKPVPAPAHNEAA